MKDLYRRNQLQPLEDNVVKINNSKGQTPEDAEAAFSILLNEERKLQYDQAYKALSAVAILRNRFDLNSKNNWQGRYSDFVVEGELKLKQKAKESSQAPVNNERASSTGKKQSNLLYVMLGAVGLVFIAAMFTGPTDQQKSEEVKKELEKNIWKYTLEDVALYESPNVDSDVVGEIKQFEDTRVFVNKGSRQWDYLHYGYLEGYVQKDLLKEGNGESALVQHCKGLPISRPANGSSLLYSTLGPHTLIIINPPGDDAIVKLRDMQQRAVLSYYVHGGQTLTVNDIPDGDYVFSYAIGKSFSPSCGRFLEGMRAWKDSNVVSFRMEKTGSIEHTASETFSLKDQFTVNEVIETKTF